MHQEALGQPAMRHRVLPKDKHIIAIIHHTLVLLLSKRELAQAVQGYGGVSIPGDGQEKGRWHTE